MGYSPFWGKKFGIIERKSVTRPSLVLVNPPTHLLSYVATYLLIPKFRIRSRTLTRTPTYLTRTNGIARIRTAIAGVTTKSCPSTS